MPYRAPKCIFCGSLDVTKEHVFPRWSHKYMPPRTRGKATASTSRQYLDRTETKFWKFSGQMRDWQVQCVCGGTHLTCNGGWMKAIEDKAKKILVPLILGEECRLYSADQAVIATWATLKNIVAEYNGRSQITVHHMQRKYLMRHKTPPIHGWGIWIANFDRKKWIPEWVSRPMLITTVERANDPATHFNANATTQVLGKLFIHVIHTPAKSIIDFWRFPVPQGGAIFRIWPPATTSIKWPIGALTDTDAEVISEALFNFLHQMDRERRAAST